MRISFTVLACCLSVLLVACGRDALSPTVQLTAQPTTLASLIPICETCDGNYPPPPPPTPPGISLPGFTNTYCRSATTNTADDIDGDRLRDECEYQLAAAFAPQLVQPNEFNYANGGVPGEYLFAVGPAPASAGIRIGYLPAYYWDWGNVYNNSGAHTGDSEFIIVEVLNDPGTSRWRTVSVFLSAHCGALLPFIGWFEADPDCQWWGPEYFAFVNGVYQGAPVVWVSNRKHANYISFARCQGGTAIDRCDDGPRVYRRFPISREYHVLPNARPNWHLIPPRRYLDWVDPTKLEDFSRGDTETKFNGWQGLTFGGGSTAYGDILRLFNVYYNPGHPATVGECDRTAKVC
jgi:hypothetical protein